MADERVSEANAGFLLRVMQISFLADYSAGSMSCKLRDVNSLRKLLSVDHWLQTV